MHLVSLASEDAGVACFVTCRALYNAGFQNVNYLAGAGEDDVKKALAAGLPGAVKRAHSSKYDDCEGPANSS